MKIGTTFSLSPYDRASEFAKGHPDLAVPSRKRYAGTSISGFLEDELRRSVGNVEQGLAANLTPLPMSEWP